jgi:hypothetical protein
MTNTDTTPAAFLATVKLPRVGRRGSLIAYVTTDGSLVMDRAAAGQFASVAQAATAGRLMWERMGHLATVSTAIEPA